MAIVEKIQIHVFAMHGNKKNSRSIRLTVIEFFINKFTLRQNITCQEQQKFR